MRALMEEERRDKDEYEYGFRGLSLRRVSIIVTWISALRPLTFPSMNERTGPQKARRLWDGWSGWAKRF
jgi:hypothetical protein